ncbi:hypothetical protein ACJMK2_036128 [Sinanodonta woodiana]|uniref:Uncharacterized protein n=1 Tax=Sinanodonta woodiana TaxID=1069815 RepID=A0ABD3WG86_SINWO
MAPGPVEELALVDLERSNRGASKQRRDQINIEIATMRDLLPLPETARQRLSQLQIMSLSCVYIRKCNILQKLFQPGRGSLDMPYDFSQALTGFILVTTRDGKLVYISENVTEYLGHSMVDMKTQGDSLFDIVDKRDHGTVQAQLMQGTAGEVPTDHQISFFCRMNMSRTLKRQGGFGDVKVMYVRGHCVNVSGQDSGADQQQVFMALCTPLITPDIKESLIQNNTFVFKSVHKLDMTFLEVTQNGEHHLGISNEEICQKSWYHFLHPEDIHEARAKHIQLIKSRHEMGCMMTIRMIAKNSDVIYVHLVMHVRQALDSHSDDPVIVCINQVVSEQEAKQFKIQGQLFALYASRAPDFFFGTHHFAPLVTSIDPDAINRGHTPAFIHHPGVFHNQQRFETYLPQPAIPGHPPSPQQYAYERPGMDQFGGQQQGRTDTLRALKRKIQENFISSCKPNKVARINGAESNGSSGFSDCFGRNGQMMLGVNTYRNIESVFAGGQGDLDVITDGPIQIEYQSSFAPNIISSKKETLVQNSVQISAQSVSCQKSRHFEQVVPEVHIPDCYLTPDPSPASSPKPSICHTVTKADTIELKHLTTFVMESLNELKEREKLSTSVQCQQVEVKKKNLPVIDVSFVDNFFDEICIPCNSLQIKTEPLSPPPQSHLPNVALLLTNKIPSMKINEEVTRVPIKEEIPIVEQSDLDDLLAYVDSTVTESVQTESPDVQKSLSPGPNDCLISAMSPTLSCRSPEMFSHQQSQDSVSSGYTSDSSPGYDGRDDILDPDSWLLEPIEMSLDMTLVGSQSESTRKTPSSDGLYQLKQLLSTWTPCGSPESNRNTQ